MGELYTALITAVSIAVASLGTYGIATLLADYDGPFDLFSKLRSKKGSKVFECSVCLTPYIALLLCLGMGLGFFSYLAIIGLTIIIARNV